MQFTIYYLKGISDFDIFYVGITTYPLKQRLSTHKIEAANGLGSNLAKSSAILNHWDNLSIYEIETIDSKGNMYPNLIEKYWMNQFKEWGFPICNAIGFYGFPRRKKKLLYETN